MRKIGVFTVLVASLSLSGCSFQDLMFWKKKNNEPEQQQKEEEQSPAVVEEGYLEKDVNIYRKPGVVDKTFKLRFYEDSPNVPYVTPMAYYKEFFNTDLVLTKTGSTYKYSRGNDYIAFDTQNNILISKGLTGLDNHPDFKSSTGKLFITLDKIESTPESERAILLNNYSIDVFENGEQAYVPLSLMSRLVGGPQMYDIAYNGKDIYVIDKYGQLGEVVEPANYGDEYYSILDDQTTLRSEDMAKYTYNELCFVFDNLRGYTEHLIFGDNNLLSLGLNGLLDMYAPKTKEYLLSLDKSKYCEGLYALFNGLYDNGHTGILAFYTTLSDAVSKKSEQEFIDLQSRSANAGKKQTYAGMGASLSRINVFGSGLGKQYYKFDETTKTAYIGFTSFTVDYDGWDDFYNNRVENAPVDTDTYAFVRSKLYQAKTDAAENVVLDLTSNGGGSSYALEGVVGLLNAGKSVFDMNDVFNKYRISEHHLIDINLDGEFNELDAIEANSFNFNIGVLTSAYSFSCANLLPSTLKGLGYKIIGEQSGGGSCAVSLETTADGVYYVHSSYLCLSDAAGNNIDSGVPVDFEIPFLDEQSIPGVPNYNNFFNFELVSNYLSTAYSN